MVRIIESWKGNVDYSTYYTVQVSEGKYVDVKCCADGFGYIIQCDDGNEVYDYNQNTYKQEIQNRNEIINDVLKYHNNINKKGTM